MYNLFMLIMLVIINLKPIGLFVLIVLMLVNVWEFIDSCRD
jgi:hypothetical protein